MFARCDLLVKDAVPSSIKIEMLVTTTIHIAFVNVVDKLQRKHLHFTHDENGNVEHFPL